MTNFPRVKELYELVCDLPPGQRRACLEAATPDPVLIAEVLHLCEGDPGRTERFAQPVLNAMSFLASAPVQPGDVLGAWTLAEQIGQGGMGRVFRARRSDGHFDQLAAIKLLGTVVSRTALEYLARERQILASLVHPNIARLIDGGSTPHGQPFLVMEYVEGLPIDDYCRRHALPLAARFRLFADVCAAVAYAHRNLVVHCDLKPSNLLVTTSGRPILLDFGIARLLVEARAEGVAPGEGAAAVAEQSNRAYTLRYASPEQIAQQRLGTTTDVYSLGLMLAELCGTHWEAGRQPDLGALPADLAAIIGHAIAPDPTQRYASADALAADLLRYQARQPVKARTPDWLYVGRRWLQRNWPWVTAAVLFLGTVLGFSWQMRAERNRAVQSEQAATAVKDYMLSVFQGADPEVAGRRDLPVSTFLDAGLKQMQQRLRDQPAVQVDLSGLLASVYLNIGRREQAVALLKEAITQERGLGRPLVLGNLLHQLAYTQYDAEDFPGAEAPAREALALRQTTQPASEALVDSLRQLGTIRLYQGDRKEALALLEQALAMANRVSGADSLSAARVHTDFGRYHIFTDPVPDAAVRHGRRAMDILAPRVGTDHYLYVNALEIVAIALGRTKDQAAALPLARELSEKRIALYGEISNQTGYALYAYADLQKQTGDRLAAVPVIERALHIQAELDGEQTLASEAELVLLGELLLGAGDLDRATPLFEQCVDIRTRLLPVGQRGLDESQYYLGRIARLQGDLARAEVLTTNTLAARAGNPDTHPFNVDSSRLELVALRRQQGRLEEAEAELGRVAPDGYADEPSREAYTVAERAQLRAARGDHVGALADFAAAETMLAAGKGAMHPDVWLLALDHAELLARDGQAAAARALAGQIWQHAAPSIAPTGLWAQHLRRLGAAPH